METRGDAEQPRLTCSVDVLPGRASAIQMALAGLEVRQRSQHSRSTCSSHHVPESIGKHDHKDGASFLSCFTFLITCSEDGGASATCTGLQSVTAPTPSQHGN